jgi:hypothetical protein
MSDARYRLPVVLLIGAMLCACGNGNGEEDKSDAAPADPGTAVQDPGVADPGAATGDEGAAANQDPGEPKQDPGEAPPSDEGEPPTDEGGEDLCAAGDGDCCDRTREGLWAPCTRENEQGTCAGEKTCLGAGGWGGCTAIEPTAEVCDGTDSDCDGETDEGLSALCSCGDGKCEAEGGETVEICPCDCAVCGDDICSPCGESPATCPADCCRTPDGPSTCGDGFCLGYGCGENPDACEEDCGADCGNGTCDRGEHPVWCPQDCKRQHCGNHACEPTDGGPEGCPADCAPKCGDCRCQGTEGWLACPIDCGFCGDGVCGPCPAARETAETCPLDCAPRTEESPLVEALLGPEGGQISSRDGKVALVVPEGALRGEVLLAVVPVELGDRAQVGPVYGIGPSGLEFLRPVTVSLTVGDEEAASGDFKELIAATWTSMGWRHLPLTVSDGPGKKVQGLTTHLSTFGLVRRSVPARLSEACPCRGDCYTTCCSREEGTPHFTEGSCACDLGSPPSGDACNAETWAAYRGRLASIRSCYAECAGVPLYQGHCAAAVQGCCENDLSGVIGVDASDVCTCDLGCAAPTGEQPTASPMLACLLPEAGTPEGQPIELHLPEPVCQAPQPRPAATLDEVCTIITSASCSFGFDMETCTSEFLSHCAGQGDATGDYLRCMRSCVAAYEQSEDCPAFRTCEEACWGDAGC